MSKVEVLKQTIADLKAARTLLERPNGWTRGAEARNNKGEDVFIDDPQACRFCTIGAMNKVIGSNRFSERFNNVDRAMESVMVHPNAFDCIADINDLSTTKHKHVLMSFDLAILQTQDELKTVQRTKKVQA